MRILFFVFIFITNVLNAKVRLPHLISDHMILQQDSNVRLWGWGTPEKEICVNVSWSNNVYKTYVNENGRWEVMVKTPSASYTPLHITFDDGDKITLNNILSGEVWICGGQSNMEMTMKGFPACPIEGYLEEVLAANKTHGIHFVDIPRNEAAFPQEDVECQWKAVNAQTVADCSAVGYFFATKLNKELNVPVGLILANKGGTAVECWLNQENIRKHTMEPFEIAEIRKKYDEALYGFRPMLCWNGILAPVISYTVRGMLWYQGCANVGHFNEEYADRLKLFINQCRAVSGNPLLPFGLVEIAPFDYGWVKDRLAASKIRESQHRVSLDISNCGFVSTNDLVYSYERKQIHPAKKKEIGLRLAYWALNEQYGIKELPYKNMQFEEMRIEDGKCYLKFENTYGGLNRWEDIQGFEVAGADRVFHPADAFYDWRQELVISAPAVPFPVAVRYCFKDFQTGNVKNAAGLPLIPFRTDDWLY